MWIQKGIIVLVTLVSSISVLYAAQSIRSVQVKGNQRIEQDAILNQVLSKPRSVYSIKKIRDSIENIYQMGFFDNVIVDAKETSRGVVLTYIVKEKPAVRKIKYEGNNKVDLDEIKDVVGIRAYSILDLNKIKKTKEAILKLYEQKGFFLARVVHRIDTFEKENEVELVFIIEELDKVKIRKINFIGNKAFDDDELRGIIATKEKGFFSWITKSDNYQEELFKGDIEGLNYFYHTKGFVQVKVDPPLVTVSPDKKWIDIAVTIHEGDIYDVGKVEYDGELIFSEREFKEKSLVETDTVFDRDKLRLEVLRLADMYKDEGYAYANVNVRSSVENKKKRVNLAFDFEKGEKVYIRRINVTGNANTRDKVIRRELRLHEGDLYNETRLKKSINRVRALGYFGEVTYTKPPGDVLNEMDINIEVTERSTGALTLGAGWSSVDAIIANAQISHNNLFGKGQAVKLNAQVSGASSRFSLSFTEPYTYDTLWSSGFDAYKTETETVDFTEEKKGGDIRVGHPIGEYVNTYLTYKLEDLDLSDVDVASQSVISAEGLVSAVLGTLIFDNRNNRYEPSKGFYDSLMLEFAGLGGDNHFFKSYFVSRYYVPSYLNGVFRVNFEAASIIRTTSDKIPTTERFILGGVNSLRGFRPFSLGPIKQNSKGENVLVGGTRQFFSNIEYEIPLIRAMGVKGVLFYDIGSAFTGSRVSSLKQDVGFGFRWFSPFGPIRVEVGFPIRRDDDEKAHVVQFAITPPF